MDNSWNKITIQQLITDQTEESLALDYKAAGALSKADRKKIEITKDVSAMANSAGGIIIYGVAEFQDSARQHLPEKIDPIDRTEISKEWLEQVINTIRPKINGIVIYSVDINLSSNEVVYVVEIPQSTTAHQARNHKYYKRFNFMSTSMEDYEVRDVMARSQHPQVELNFRIRPKFDANQFGSHDNHLVLTANIYNSGSILAKYITTFIHIPKSFIGGIRVGLREFKNTNGIVYYQMTRDNLRTHADINGVLLPEVSREWFEIRLSNNFDIAKQGDIDLMWRIHADNALPVQEVIPFKDLPFVGLDSRS